MTLPHIPILRLGEEYASLDAADLANARGGAPIARISQANAGLIRRDARRFGQAASALRKIPCRKLLDICADAAGRFLNDDLPLGKENSSQSPDDYLQSIGATCGLPHALIRMNMNKIAQVLTEAPAILKGLMRGLNLEVLDCGSTQQDGMQVSYYPAGNVLGAVLPSNSPGVNSLWIPAIALKVPVILKPGREEPWTPWRIIQALIAAGCPRQAFGFYPTDHEGSAAILDTCSRSLIFGDQNTIGRYADNAAIQVHGPGYSKVLIGEDKIDHWPEYLDLLVDSIAANGGRSCINASTIVVPRRANEIAESLAQRLAALTPRAQDHPQAALAAFANTAFAEHINQTIDNGMKTPGAEDITARQRGDSPRLCMSDELTYLLPTLIRCQSLDHPLANREFLFPYASVVQVSQDQMLDKIGPSLVVSAITEDAALTERLLQSPLIERLNLGAMATTTVRWDQPHEGNLFEFLYRRRAIQYAV